MTCTMNWGQNTLNMEINPRITLTLKSNPNYRNMIKTLFQTLKAIKIQGRKI